MKQSRLNFLIAFITLLFSFPSLAAPVGENSGEIWVDGPAPQPGSDPSYPDAAVDNSGRSIFVWKAFTANRNDIFLRFFDVGGSPPGDPVLVNTRVEDDQTFPRIAASSDRSFLVVWQSDEPDPNVMVDRKWVRSQAFTAAGEPDGVEQLLSMHSSGEATDINADVAALPDGGYVVVWRSRPSDGSGVRDIWARRVGARGEPLDVPFIANSTEDETENYPAVTELADGGFLVVWTGPELHGRRFMADGTPVGEDFQINTLIDARESRPDAVLHEDGRVLVTWEDEGESADGSWEIRGRLFNPELVAQGMDFQINTLSAGDQLYPRAADYGQGGFFVVWQSAVSAGNDNEPPSIEGRILTDSNQFAGPQFLVNSWTESSQQFPGIGGKGGRIAVGWHAKSNPDSANNVINGQFWSVCGIFCDGFE